MTDLWESIFTPGPTPTILKATNITFAALQSVLFLLLLATYSVHCVVLSVLCAGLWWSVNWFAAELQAAQLREQQEQKQREKSKEAEDSDTEVEGSKVIGGKTGKKASVSASAEVEPQEQTGDLKKRGETVPGTQSSASTEDEWEKVSESEQEKDK